MTREKKPTTLEELATDLLEKYYDAQETVIWEFGNIEYEMKKLDKYRAETTQLIKELGLKNEESRDKYAKLEQKLKEYMNTLSEADPTSAAALARRWRDS